MRRRRGTTNQDLHTVEKTQNGIRFATGVPVTFPFMRNPEPAPPPPPGDPFGQLVEPAGTYLLTLEIAPELLQAPWQHGTISFSNPLVLALVWPPDREGDAPGYRGERGWKRRLSAAYGGKTGLALSKAILADGHDAVVTVSMSGVRNTPGYVSEIVDLRPAAKWKPRRGRSNEAPLWIQWSNYSGTAVLVRQPHHDSYNALAGISLEEEIWHPKGACGDALDRLDTFGRPWAVTSVGFTRRGQSVRQMGYGRALYRAALLNLAFEVDADIRVLEQLWPDKGIATIVPDACGGTRPTSESARRAWSILAGELRHESFHDRKGELFALTLTGPEAVEYAQRNGLLTRNGRLRSPLPADALLEPFTPVTRQRGRTNESVVRYHLTDNPRFALDPTYCPQDNALSIADRSGRCGLYVAPSVEPWVNGHGYWRPFVVEFRMDPAVEGDPGVHGRWGRELFVPAASFHRLELLRVIPLDAHAREIYGEHGWIEERLGREFDTGRKIAQRSLGEPWSRPFPNGYRYPGPDVRWMPMRLARRLARDLKRAIT